MLQSSEKDFDGSSVFNESLFVTFVEIKAKGGFCEEVAGRVDGTF